MNTFIFLGIALGVGIIGYLLWIKSGNLPNRLFGVLIIGPSATLVMHLMFTIFQAWFGYGPGSSGGLKEWLNYGFSIGVIPLIAVVGIMLAIAVFPILLFFIGGGSDYIVTRNSFGGYNVSKNDLSDSFGCFSLLPLAVIALIEIPYGWIYGSIQWFLYQISLEKTILTELIPVGIMTFITWTIGVLFTLFYSRKTRNNSSTVESA